MSDLLDRIVDLERLTRNLPSRWVDRPAVETWLLIIGGNTLDSTQPGVKHSSGVVDALTAVPDAYLDTALPDYVGRAWIFRDGVQGVVPDGTGGMKPERVLVVNDSRGIYPNALVAGDWLRVYLQGQLGATVTDPGPPVVYGPPFYAYLPAYL